MKGRQKQHSIFIELGKNLAHTKPHVRKETHSFFSNKPTFNHTALPSTAPHISSTQTATKARRKASMPIQPKKVPTATTLGMNDEFLHNRKESYLNSQFNMRQNRLKEISKENKQIHNRINSQKSVYSSQDLKQSYELNNGIKKRLSQSKLSQRSSSSRISDRSKASSRKGERPELKKKDDIKIQIKTTNIQKVPDRDLKGFKGMFFGSKTTDHK